MEKWKNKIKFLLVNDPLATQRYITPGGANRPEGDQTWPCDLFSCCNEIPVC